MKTYYLMFIKDDFGYISLSGKMYDNPEDALKDLARVHKGHIYGTSDEEILDSFRKYNNDFRIIPVDVDF